MAAASFPTDVKVFIDDQDITKAVFGTDTVTLTDAEHEWTKIDISKYLKYPGTHKLKITAGSGVGRVDARVKLF